MGHPQAGDLLEDTQNSPQEKWGLSMPIFARVCRVMQDFPLLPL